MSKLLLRAVALFILGCWGIPSSALAADLPPVAGSYYCYTTNLVITGGRIDTRTMTNGAGINPLMVMPAFFGNLVLDGKGQYRLTQRKGGGSYSFDGRTGTLTFTGDLSVMSVQRYSSANSSFFLVYNGMAFHCGIPGKGGGGTAVGPAISKSQLGTGSRSDFTGLFRGEYLCGGKRVPLILELQAAPNGDLSGTFTYGGRSRLSSGHYDLKGKWVDTSVQPSGAYSVVGKWGAGMFLVEGTTWLNQPPNHRMVGLSGNLTNGTLSGRVSDATCAEFALAKQ